VAAATPLPCSYRVFTEPLQSNEPKRSGRDVFECIQSAARELRLIKEWGTGINTVSIILRVIGIRVLITRGSEDGA
jgi:hypothetical protein